MKYIDAIENLPEEIRLALIKAFEYFKQEIDQLVRKSDFDELKAIVRELVEAQKRTELRVEELAEAQRRTEVKVEALAEAQRRTEVKVEALAEAQRRTEKELRILAQQLKITRKQLGGLEHTVGYRLEDESYKALPLILKERFAIEVIGRLKRDYLEIGKGKYIELNIYGKGRGEDKEYLIIGEAKSQLKKRDIDKFIDKAEFIRKFIPMEQIRIIVTYQTSPQVRNYAMEKNLMIIFSYEF